MKTGALALMLGALMFSGCAGCEGSDDYPIRKERSDPDGVAQQDEKPEVLTGTNRPTVVRMRKEGGVWKIPVTINGSRMEFIFDTGAGLISISRQEATRLFRQGRINEDDLRGSARFIDANGDINEGEVINLREVRIGERTLHNIRASVTDGIEAPLLFGQSAMEKFGRMSIDYKAKTITFY